MSILLQLFTAALIIYSTFAAIYYSKVNPIVSDYSYQDYLGGRSLPDSIDVDNVDPEATDELNEIDDNNSTKQTSSSSTWWPKAENVLAKTKFALQFILDALEKPPK